MVVGSCVAWRRPDGGLRRLGERLETLRGGAQHEVAIEGGELRAAFVDLAHRERCGELDGVIGAESVDAG